VGGLRVTFNTVGDCELEFLASFKPRQEGNWTTTSPAPRGRIRARIARVFGEPVPPARTELGPTPPVGTTGSVKALLDDATSALTRAEEELHRVNELLQRLWGTDTGIRSRSAPNGSSGTPR
jgi:hypothetical protein